METTTTLKLRKNRTFSRGFSLVEVMLLAGVLSIIASIGYFFITNVRESTQNTKLMRDVATINVALRVYESSGGSLAGITDPQAVLDRTKRRLTADASKQMAGLRGSMMDNRLAVVLQTNDEGASTTPRAYWRPDLAKFVVAESGGRGIKEFALDDSLATVDYGQEVRTSSMKLALSSGWVWDFSDTPAQASAAPTRPTPTPSPPDGATGPERTPLRLDPPEIQASGGNSPTLMEFPLVVTLRDLNNPGTSEILYSTSPGVWNAYSAPLSVNPGTQLFAIASSIDPENWEDSLPSTGQYDVTPTKLAIAQTFTKNNMSYMDMLGPLVPGNYTPKTVKEKGSITLTNANVIPDAYENSTNMQLLFTKNGQSPLLAGALQGAPFSNGYTVQSVNLDLTDWGSASTITVKSAMKALNTTYFTTSDIASTTLDISRTPLRDILISASTTFLVLSLQPDFGDTPLNARIYYTLDGTDPGDNNGEPLRGTLYTGPVDLSATTGGNIPVSARLYPPVAYKNWFTTSRVATSSLPAPVSTDFYVGGEFYLPSGASVGMRNIAKLKGAGSLDTSFDVGSGASIYSIVGIIRATNAGVMAGGDFESMNGLPLPAAARLTNSGSVDPTFNANLR